MFKFWIPIKIYDSKSSKDLDLTNGTWRLVFKYNPVFPSVDRKDFNLFVIGKTYAVRSAKTNKDRTELVVVLTVTKTNNAVPIMIILGGLALVFGVGVMGLVLKRVEKVVEASPKLLYPIAGVGGIIYLWKKL